LEATRLRELAGADGLHLQARDGRVDPATAKRLRHPSRRDSLGRNDLDPLLHPCSPPRVILDAIGMLPRDRDAPLRADRQVLQGRAETRFEVEVALAKAAVNAA